MAKRFIDWSCKDRQGTVQDVRDLIGATSEFERSGTVLALVSKGTTKAARRKAERFNTRGKGRFEFIENDEP